MPIESPYPLVSIEHALNTILAHSSVLGTERVPLIQALDCVLAEDVFAPASVPPFPAAAKDGYAVVAADTGRLLSLVGANALLELPPSAEDLPAGAQVSALLLQAIGA
jgi:molybdopterin biosynthesis enzyme